MSSERADILIACRDKLQLDALKQLLRSISRETMFVAGDAAKARDFLTYAAPSTIFVAEGLQGMEACAFIRAVRKEKRFQSRKAHIIYVAHADLHAAGLAAGAHAGLALPISLSAMMQAMARVKSDDRPFIDRADYSGPCRRVQRSGPAVPKRRHADKIAKFEALRVTLATAAKTKNPDVAAAASAELLAACQDLDDPVLVTAVEGLCQGIGAAGFMDERLAVMVEEFATALTHLHRIGPCPEREILHALVMTLCDKIRAKAQTLGAVSEPAAVPRAARNN